MSKEEKLAANFIDEIEAASRESYVNDIFQKYISYIKVNGLDKEAFLKYLHIKFSLITESQTPEQTLKNTIAAMALLKGEKKK